MYEPIYASKCMPNLLIVIASTRPGRAGLPVGRWFADIARGHSGFEVDVVDLLELDLPFVDEPQHPRLRRYTMDHTLRWSASVDAADAVVFVTSEYNFGYPAPLKNAIDYLHDEWRHKPLGYVSYGGIAAGTRAVQQLKQVTQSVGMVSAQRTVSIPWIAERIDDKGVLLDDDVMRDGAVGMLDELLELNQVLRPLREPAQAG